MGSYLVSSLAPAAFAFPINDGLEYQNSLPDDQDEVRRMQYSSYWTESSTGVLIPTNLQMNLVVNAATIDDATLIGQERAGSFIDLIAFCANAATGTAAIHQVLDISSGETARELREYYVLAGDTQLRPMRGVLPSDMGDVFTALHAFYSESRFTLALAHYQAALQFYQRPTLLFSFESLCIASETLAHLFLLRELAVSGMSEEQCARSIGIDVDSRRGWKNDLRGRMRLKFIFSDDRDLYSSCKKASDGFEHGFMNPNEVRDTAMQSTEKLFGLVRAAIFIIAGATGEACDRSRALPPVGLQPIDDAVSIKIGGWTEVEEAIISGSQSIPKLGIRVQITNSELVGDHWRTGRNLSITPLLPSGATMLSYSLGTVVPPSVVLD